MTIEAKYAVLGLLTALIVAILCVTALALTGHTVPDVLTVVIGGAMAGVTGILVPTAPRTDPTEKAARAQVRNRT